MIDAATFQPDKLTLSKPEKKKKENISFVVVPLQYENKPALLKLTAGLKILKHDSKDGNVNFSLGITPENVDVLSQIEKRIRNLAGSCSKEIKRADPGKVLHVEDLRVLKTDKSEKQKVFAKLFSREREIQVPFRSVEKDSKGKREELYPSDLIGLPLHGMVILHFSRVFVGTVSSIAINVKEVLVKQVVRPASLFDQYEEIDEKEEESD